MEELKVLQSKLKAQLPDLELREQEPMRLHTTFRVGGPASLMALPRREADLGQLLRMAFQAGVTPFFLGKGSNLLVADEGVDRFLIKLAGGLNRLERAEGTAIYVGRGVTLAQAAVFAAHHGLTGLEFAHGIPGTMGGGVFMNAGAYEGEMSQVVDWVDCLDEEGMPRRLSREALALGYRSSIFLRRPWLITGAHLTLAPGDPAAIREKMADLSRRRRAKQPLEYPSAGSTFKRPAGHFAGGLIEQCGLKGTTVGGAQVSEKHAGFVINTGQATCQDILTLIRLVRDRVFQQTGVRLEPEVRLLGCTLEEP